MEMLLQFSVENYLSIKEPVTLSMLASKDRSLDHNLIKGTDGKHNFVKSAVLYGANASGKSNVVKALAFMKNFVLTCLSLQRGDKIDVVPFKLSEKTRDGPSAFEVIFVKDGVKYCYGFKLDSSKVYEEHLYHYPNAKQAIIFERYDVNKYRFIKDTDEQSILSRRTLDNRLYLSTSSEWNYKETPRVFEWFRDDLVVKVLVDKLEWLPYTANMLMDNHELSGSIKNLISIADTGVSDLVAKMDEVPDVADFPKDMLDFVKKIILDTGAKRLNVKTMHVVSDKLSHAREVFFDLSEESMGTIKLFDLAGRWLESLRHGRVLVLDELDSSLHPNILDALLGQFHNSLTNRKNAQLIFTTHSTDVLNLDTFRRDQIWLTEKNPASGATDLYSLSEVAGVRKDENIAKGYLAGRYGGVPFIGGLLKV